MVITSAMPSNVPAGAHQPPGCVLANAALPATLSPTRVASLLPCTLLCQLVVNNAGILEEVRPFAEVKEQELVDAFRVGWLVCAKG